jgi:hypothetical protein
VNERDTKADVEESPDRAISGLDRTASEVLQDSADIQEPGNAAAAGPGDLEEGEEWAEARTQESWEEGADETAQTSLGEGGRS